ncbi:MAG: glutathione S-transferase family protein [Gammaproteobacteria bacterium]|nr:glutathione S-transferase family protein [Gammaproteobacteria bacterium]
MTAVLYIGNRNYSSWSMRGWLLARTGGLAFTEQLIPLNQSDSAEKAARISPSGLVPCLHVDGLVVWDSLAIAEYLHERFPDAGIWPRAPAPRAAARSICAEMHSGFSALRKALPMDIRRRHPAGRLSEPVGVEIRRINRIWAECRARYGDRGDFLFGDWSGADCQFAPVVMRFRSYGIEQPDPILRRYMAAVCEWRPVAEWCLAAQSEPWHIEYEVPGAAGAPEATPGGS